MNRKTGDSQDELGAAISAAFAHEELPEGLNKRLKRSLHSAPRNDVPRLASSLTRRAVLIGLVTGSLGLTQIRFRSGTLSDEPLREFIEFISRGSKVDIGTLDPIATHDWLTSHVNFSFPSLRRDCQGLHLIGGRICVVSGRMMASCVYRSGQELLAIYITDGTQIQFATNQQFIVRSHMVSLLSSSGFNQIMWKEHGLVYALVSNMSLDRSIAALADLEHLT